MLPYITKLYEGILLFHVAVAHAAAAAWISARTAGQKHAVNTKTEHWHARTIRWLCACQSDTSQTSGPQPRTSFTFIYGTTFVSRLQHQMTLDAGPLARQTRKTVQSLFHLTQETVSSCSYSLAADRILYELKRQLEQSLVRSTLVLLTANHRLKTTGHLRTQPRQHSFEHMCYIVHSDQEPGKITSFSAEVSGWRSICSFLQVLTRTGHRRPASSAGKPAGLRR